MSSNGPYPPDTQWTYSAKKNGFTRSSALTLYWEVSGDPISDDYTPDDISAEELWELWYPRNVAPDGTAAIYWMLYEPMEGAPFEIADLAKGTPHLLDDFTWPHDAKTGERVNFARLPVRDKGWTQALHSKGGFIQELLVLQTHFAVTC